MKFLYEDQNLDGFAFSIVVEIKHPIECLINILARR